MIHAVILLISTIVGVCLAVGGVLALGIALWARDMEAALWWVGNGYYLLVGLIPVALWLGLYISHDNAEYAEAYASRGRALLTTLQAATVGSLLGAGPIFLTVVINLPVILAGFDVSEFGPAVRDLVVWSRLLIALAAALVCAFPLAWWGNYIAVGRSDK